MLIGELQLTANDQNIGVGIEPGGRYLDPEVTKKHFAVRSRQLPGQQSYQVEINPAVRHVGPGHREHLTLEVLALPLSFPFDFEILLFGNHSFGCVDINAIVATVLT